MRTWRWGMGLILVAASACAITHGGIPQATSPLAAERSEPSLADRPLQALDPGTRDAPRPRASHRRGASGGSGWRSGKRRPAKGGGATYADRATSLGVRRGVRPIINDGGDGGVPLVPDFVVDTATDSERYAYDPTTGGEITFSTDRAIDGDTDTQWANADPNTDAASEMSRNGIAWFGLDFSETMNLDHMRIKVQPTRRGSYYEARVADSLDYVPRSSDPAMQRITNRDYQMEYKPLSGSGKYLILIWHKNDTCDVDAYGNPSGDTTQGGEPYFGIFELQVYAY